MCNWNAFLWSLRASHLKRPWCWERLRAGEEGDNGGWDGWMASLTQWAWVWVNSGSWWWTGRPDVLQWMGSQIVRHDWVTKLNRINTNPIRDNVKEAVLGEDDFKLTVGYHHGDIILVSNMYQIIRGSVQFSRSVVYDSLWPHGLQHVRPPCPSPTPRVYTNSCPLSRWCHPTISSSVFPFSSCLQSFLTSGSFQMS